MRRAFGRVAENGIGRVEPLAGGEASGNNRFTHLNIDHIQLQLLCLVLDRCR